MKLALLQCDVKDADFSGNCQNILDKIQNLENGADLCIAPCGALTGPDPKVARMYAFTSRLENELKRLAGALKNYPPLLCHAPEFGYMLFKDGAWQEIEHIFKFNNLTLGVDLRPEDASLIDLGIAMEARPFYPDGGNEWELILSGFCRQGSIWAVSVNLCGGYGSKIYAGQSLAMRPDGALGARARAFAEDCLLVNTDESVAAGRLEPGPDCWQEAAWLALTLGLRDFARKNGAETVYLGLSGGMDSALTACIAAEALGAKNVHAALMPSPYTSEASLADARNLARNLGIKTCEIPIQPIMEAFNNALASPFANLKPVSGQAAAENLQARIRGSLLMALANYGGGLVLSCSNKSEAAMGYCTLYGDTVGAVSVIGDLFKTQVYQLAEWYCRKKGEQVIPMNIFRKAPSAELKPNQKDTDTLPPYDELDPQLMEILTFPLLPGVQQDPKLANLAAAVASFAFKRRQSPPVLLISGKPLDAH